jgi:peptidoglycan/LPS O-acetylase OafA/YrhL
VTNLGWELIRGQLAGLMAGATTAAVLAIGSGVEPMWHEGTARALSLGLLIGGSFGVLGGFVAGMTLRSLRNVPVALAATAAALTVAAAVTAALLLLGWTSASVPWRFPVVVGVLAGVAAAVATPWIRRSPTKASP